jgi:hypothetical protein
MENWINYCQSGNKPKNIPLKPQSYYRNRGWVGFDDWLGTSTIDKSPSLRIDKE